MTMTISEATIEHQCMTTSKYPTKKEIMEVQLTFPEPVIEAVEKWKRHWYRGWDQRYKYIRIISLQDLVYLISLTQEGEAPKVTTAEIDAYYPDLKIITIKKKHPSIISTLHEYGHHLYGDSELKACRWSIQLFKECFPYEFEELVWTGHLLTKKQ